MIDQCELDRRLIAWLDSAKNVRPHSSFKVFWFIGHNVDWETGKTPRLDVKAIARGSGVNKETVVNVLAAGEEAGVLERMEKGRAKEVASIYRVLNRTEKPYGDRTEKPYVKKESKQDSLKGESESDHPPSQEEVVLGQKLPPAEASKKPRKPKKTHRPWQPGTDWPSDDGKIVPASLTDRYPLATQNMAGFLENAVDGDGWMRRNEDRPWAMLLKAIETMLSRMQAATVDERPPEEIIPLKPWTKLRRHSSELAQMIWKLFEQDMRGHGHKKEYYRDGDELPHYGLPDHVRKIIWEEALPEEDRDDRAWRLEREREAVRARG
jgi:hypothetical protein